MQVNGTRGCYLSSIFKNHNKEKKKEISKECPTKKIDPKQRRNYTSTSPNSLLIVDSLIFFGPISFIDYPIGTNISAEYYIMFIQFSEPQNHQEFVNKFKGCLYFDKKYA